MMEPCRGKQLHQRWNDMSTVEHLHCVKAISMLVSEMTQLQFPAYGSVYFEDAAFLPDHLKISLKDGFCVGPHVGTPVWPYHPAEYDAIGKNLPLRGPFPNLNSFVSNLLASGEARQPSAEDSERLEFFGAPQDHQDLLETCERVFPALLKSSIFDTVKQPRMFHYDLNKRNIFVSEDDPAVVTGFIDWQSTSIEPAFVYNNERPDFTQPPDDFTHDEALSDSKQEGQSRRVAKDVEICARAFEVMLKGHAPILAAARELDDIVLRPFRYCATSWRDSSTALRQELFELSDNWTRLGLPGVCPYIPHETERQWHARLLEDFNDYHDMKVKMMQMLNATSDGWVSPEEYEGASAMNQELYKAWMQEVESVQDPDIPVSKGRMMWPFDVE